ncbi:GIN domain-containing protein [Congregibacter sp.]|uniref:GIN domain-containing protein n=1 Tax=Congregibacter sp. TaxID=2744308 RepID=UPI003F6B58B7
MPKVLSTSTLCSALALGMLSAQLWAQDQTRRVEGLDFDEVVVLGDAEVEISQGDEVALQLRGPADYLDTEPFYVSGDTLVVGARKRENNDDERLRFRIVMPYLEELQVKGSGTVYIKPFAFDAMGGDDPVTLTVDGSGEINAFELTGAVLELRVEGSGDFRAVSVNVAELEAVVAGSGYLFVETLTAGRGEFVVTGSGDLRVTEGGSVDELEVNVVGSGDIRMPSVNSNRAETNIVGSGSALIGEVREQLNASILGSGDVSYSGSPEVERVELGSGEVRRRD